MDLEALADKAKALGDAALLPVLDSTELHIDGDYAAYYFSGKDETPFGDARANALRTFKAVSRIAGAGGRNVIHLTAGGSDKGKRYQIATVKPYQGQRDSSRRPKNWQAMRDWLEGGGIAGFATKVWTDREADDGIAVAARYAITSGRVPGIFMRDKDSRMIPGRHIDWTTFEVIEVKPETWMLDTGWVDTNGPVIYGQIAFWLQMLMGDGADNIPGLPGQPAKDEGKFKTCGKACAMDYLAKTENGTQAFTVVRDLYRQYYGQSWASAFAEQAALLWLRTDNAASVTDWLRAVPAKSPELEQAARQLERRVA